MRHGHGQVFYSNGDMYYGEFSHGRKDGDGTYVWSNGTRYDGDWVAGKRHGKGVLTFMDGSLAEGQFRDNKMNGQGSYVYKNGDSYTGPFKDNKKHGVAVYTYKNGAKLQGEFVEGVLTGKVNWLLGRLGSYEGHFHHSKPIGRGVYNLTTPRLRQYGAWRFDEEGGKQKGVDEPFEVSFDKKKLRQRHEEIVEVEFAKLQAELDGVNPLGMSPDKAAANPADAGAADGSQTARTHAEDTRKRSWHTGALVQKPRIRAKSFLPEISPPKPRISPVVRIQKHRPHRVKPFSPSKMEDLRTRSPSLTRGLALDSKLAERRGSGDMISWPSTARF
eukprot:GFYU01005842.1.p1 GENE.GFYU01005842.1~~GFYU01005842.1.p1  ORF type:complete len:332 (-),score=81.78 GFYU01005842.1:292-1287(-)